MLILFNFSSNLDEGIDEFLEEFLLLLESLDCDDLLEREQFDSHDLLRCLLEYKLF
jgi:hypothetical protein